LKRSVAGIALNEGRYLIAKRLPGGDMGGRWEFPGGKIEEGEDCWKALEREFMEEFGIKVKATLPIGEAVFKHGEQDFLLSAFWVELPRNLMNIALTEHSEWRWASLDEILELDFTDSDRKLLPFLI
jgi:8-oxo-dGTP diphosphatase